LKKVITILFLVVILFSCENKFSGFIEKSEGVYMKLISFDEEDNIFDNDRYVVANIEVLSNNITIYKHYKENLIEPNKNKFNFLFNYLNQGDSAVFMINNKLLPIKLDQVNSEYVEVRIKANQYLKQVENIIDNEMLEQILLKKYLIDLGINENNFKNGVYVKNLQKGAGKKIKSGDLISINYKGSYINRIEFDNNYKESAFTFTYGTPGQVIKGLEIALNGMRKGEKSKIIITSQLAFGEEGSSTHIIPPFTTVVYELEIINVK